MEEPRLRKQMHRKNLKMEEAPTFTKWLPTCAFPDVREEGDSCQRSISARGSSCRRSRSARGNDSKSARRRCLPTFQICSRRRRLADSATNLREEEGVVAGVPDMRREEMVATVVPDLCGEESGCWCSRCARRGCLPTFHICAKRRVAADVPDLSEEGVVTGIPELRREEGVAPGIPNLRGEESGCWCSRCSRRGCFPTFHICRRRRVAAGEEAVAIGLPELRQEGVVTALSDLRREEGVAASVPNLHREEGLAADLTNLRKEESGCWCPRGSRRGCFPTFHICGRRRVAAGEEEGVAIGLPDLRAEEREATGIPGAHREGSGYQRSKFAKQGCLPAFHICAKRRKVAVDVPNLHEDGVAADVLDLHEEGMAATVSDLREEEGVAASVSNLHMEGSGCKPSRSVQWGWLQTFQICGGKRRVVVGGKEEVAVGVPDLCEKEGVTVGVQDLHKEEAVAANVPNLRGEEEVTIAVPNLHREEEVAVAIPDLHREEGVAANVPDLHEEGVAASVPNLCQESGCRRSKSAGGGGCWPVHARGCLPKFRMCAGKRVAAGDPNLIEEEAVAIGVPNLRKDGEESGCRRSREGGCWSFHVRGCLPKFHMCAGKGVAATISNEEAIAANVPNLREEGLAAILHEEEEEVVANIPNMREEGVAASVPNLHREEEVASSVPDLGKEEEVASGLPDLCKDEGLAAGVSNLCKEKGEGVVASVPGKEEGVAANVPDLCKEEGGPASVPNLRKEEEGVAVGSPDLRKEEGGCRCFRFARRGCGYRCSKSARGCWPFQICGRRWLPKFQMCAGKRVFVATSSDLHEEVVVVREEVAVAAAIPNPQEEEVAAGRSRSTRGCGCRHYRFLRRGWLPAFQICTRKRVATGSPNLQEEKGAAAGVPDSCGEGGACRRSKHMRGRWFRRGRRERERGRGEKEREK